MVVDALVSLVDLVLLAREAPVSNVDHPRRRVPVPAPWSPRDGPAHTGDTPTLRDLPGGDNTPNKGLLNAVDTFEQLAQCRPSGPGEPTYQRVAGTHSTSV